MEEIHLNPESDDGYLQQIQDTSREWKTRHNNKKFADKQKLTTEETHCKICFSPQIK